MIWYLIGSIGGNVLDIVDDVVEDKNEANKLKFQIQKKLLESKSTELEPQAKIVLAEAQGAFWKKHYNTPLGAWTVPKYVLKITSIYTS